MAAPGPSTGSFLDPQWTLPGRQRLQEDSQSQRQKLSTRVERENRIRRGSPLWQHPDELALGNGFVAVRRRQQPDSMAPVHERAGRVDVAARDWPRYMDPYLFSPVDQLPVALVVLGIEHHTVVRL